MIVFKDRLTQYPNRRQLNLVSGTTTTYDIVRAEGTVTQEGTLLNAQNLNNNFNEIKGIADLAKTTAESAKLIAEEVKSSVINGQGTLIKKNNSPCISLNLSASGSRWNVLPDIESNGTMATGKYIDFYESTTASTKSARIESSNGLLKTSGGITATGEITATSFNATSDLRKKENLKYLNSFPTKKLINLPLYEYNYIDDKDKKKYPGLIAQDLIEALGDESQLFVEKDSEGFFQIRESKLVYLLLSIIKDQDERISTLEQKA